LGATRATLCPLGGRAACHAHLAAIALIATCRDDPKEAESEILRLFCTEKWRIGTIADQLALHHTTVQRVLLQTGVESKELSAWVTLPSLSPSSRRSPRRS
jgi:hypothetical protein